MSNDASLESERAAFNFVPEDREKKMAFPLKCSVSKNLGYFLKTKEMLTRIQPERNNTALLSKVNQKTLK